jgi:hypothetical protein
MTLGFGGSDPNPQVRKFARERFRDSPFIQFKFGSGMKKVPLLKKKESLATLSKRVASCWDRFLAVSRVRKENLPGCLISPANILPQSSCIGVVSPNRRNFRQAISSDVLDLIGSKPQLGIAFVHVLPVSG